MKKTGPLNNALREIVRVDNERCVLLDNEVLQFSEFKRLKEERRSFVAALQKAKR